MGECPCIAAKKEESDQKDQKDKNITKVNTSKESVDFENYDKSITSKTKQLKQSTLYFDKKTVDEEAIKKGNTLVISNDVFISKNTGIDPFENYKKIKQLGKGAFGEVWLVEGKQLPDHQYAMKIIKRNENKPSSDNDIINEMNLLKTLDHPNIVKILDFYMNDSNCFIVTEYCPEGELFDELMKVKKFSEVEGAFIMEQLFHAIKYCHKMKVIHRDIKPENIMITKREENGCLQVKLIDFGTAKIFERGHIENRVVGSAYYIAPEVIKRNYDETCDIWSLGVVMYILLTGIPPFGGKTDEDIIEKIKVGVYNTKSYKYQNLSDEAKDLIKQLLTYDPKQRISIKEVLDHKWFESKEFQKVTKIKLIEPGLAKEMFDNISKYRSDNKLKCAVIAYLVHNNTNLEECQQASKLFNQIDLNADGKIEQEELEKGLVKYWGISERESKIQAENIFRNLDTDYNKYIEYEEFVRAAIDPETFTSPYYLKFAFNYFDTNHTGEISADDIKRKFTQSLTNKNNEDIDERLNKIYRNMNIKVGEKITMDSFSKMMNTILS